MSKRKRLNGKVRREEILTAAITLAERVGYTNIDRAGVSKAAKCSEALVSSYFGTMPQLQKAVMRAAVARECLKVIAQGLAIQDKHALKAPPDIKTAAANAIAAG